jgi:hypothetical protein
MKYISLLLITLALFSCRKEPEEVEENDVITTIKLTVADTATGSTSTDYYFRDLDGEGGNNPVTDTMQLQAGKEYSVQLDLSNERQTPAQSVTAEINANKDEHQLFFKPTPVAALTSITYKDFDENGKPLGLAITFHTQATSATGTLEIILRHHLNKNGINVSNGDIANAGGESEVEVDFPFSIE